MKLRTIEISFATIVLMMALYSLFGTLNSYVNNGYNSVHSFDRDIFAAKGIQFNFFINYLLPFILLYVVVYGTCIWICCSLPNKLIAQRAWGKALLYIAIGWVILWLIMVWRDYLLVPYKEHIVADSLYKEIGVATGITTMILMYEAVKHSIIWLLKYERIKNSLGKNDLAKDVIWFFLVWGLAVLAVIFLHAYWGVAMFIELILPCAFLVYLASLYWLIPHFYYRENKAAFTWLTILVTLGINFPFNGIYSSNAAANRAPYILSMFFVLWLFQLVILIPLTLFIHKLRQERVVELTGLKTRLGTSNANLQFLRSQINPHFLFNALNTLYGTALMEKAGKTGEGIQKLGDMMRFMLHENNQDKIALSREIDYVHNYIDLQTMRLALSPDVTVDVQIEDILGYDEIAPMLLIPFVENAYKHGISLQEKSWININLFKKDRTLHLDVHNSIHPVNLNDPERHHSGTGLENVKQRLQLLYPGKHELVIRQNTKEFFIHLSLELNTQ